MTNKATVNLDAVPSIAGTVTVFGETHDVRDLDGDDYRFVNAGGDLDIVGMYTLAEKLIPTLGAEKVNRLTGKQLALIVRIADGRVKEVEAQFPNESGPETSETPMSPA